MKIPFTFSVILALSIIAQGIFAALILWRTNRNKLSNRLLATLLIAISLWLIDTFFNIGEIYQQDPDFYFLPIYYSLGFGPLIYFYVKSLTNSQFKFSKVDLLHFLPVLIQGGLYWYLTFQNYEFRRWYWVDVHLPYTYSIEFDGTFLSLAIYGILSLQLILKYQGWLKDNFSEVSKIRLNWLKVLLSLLLVLCILWFVEVIMRNYFDSFAHNYSVIVLGILTLVIGFEGIRQSNLSHVNFVEKEKEEKESSMELDAAILDKIKNRMEGEKDYLNPTLSLKEFSKALQIPSRIVSFHINKGFNKSFLDFVNEYRIKEVKRKLETSDMEVYTLLAIAYDCGFNSKSTFYRIFKKFTGQSPSNFKK